MLYINIMLWLLDSERNIYQSPMANIIGEIGQTTILRLLVGLGHNIH